MANVRVTIEVEYDPETVGDIETVASDLEWGINNAIGSGLLTGPDHEGIVLGHRVTLTSTP